MKRSMSIVAIGSALATKYAAAGQFKNLWREGLFSVINYPQTRAVEFLIGSKVAPGGWPTWSLNWSSGSEPASQYT